MYSATFSERLTARQLAHFPQARRLWAKPDLWPDRVESAASLIHSRSREHKLE